MSIQLIARDLYRLLREVESLEKEAAAATGQRKAILTDQLRKLRAEYRRMRAVLDGQKDDNRPKRRFDG
jgi:hypothetical protein